MRRLGLITRLSLADLAHEWRMTACFVVALAAVLAPLLVLLGLKTGVVDALVGRLVREPTMRAITLVGSGRFDDAFFATLKGRREVGFVVPATRQIAATMDLIPADREAPAPVAVELLPTAAGDPLGAGELADGFTSLTLSASAARKLGVAAGGTLRGIVTRSIDGRLERTTIPLTVKAVLDPAAFGRDGALISVGLSRAIENYRDGIAVPDLGWAGKDPPATPPPFTSFRLYARTIDDVAGLAAFLAGQNLEVTTRAAEIETVKALDRNLTAIFGILAGIGGAGFLLSLAASLWANVDRKRKELAILALIGFRRGEIASFPTIQAAGIAVLGSAVAVGVFEGVAAIVNRAFPTGPAVAANEAACVLDLTQIGAASGVTLALALVAALLAGGRASRVEPSEGLRDV